MISHQQYVGQKAKHFSNRWSAHRRTRNELGKCDDVERREDDCFVARDRKVIETSPSRIQINKAARKQKTQKSNNNVSSNNNSSNNRLSQMKYDNRHKKLKEVFCWWKNTGKIYYNITWSSKHFSYAGKTIRNGTFLKSLGVFFQNLDPVYRVDLRVTDFLMKL